MSRIRGKGISASIGLASYALASAFAGRLPKTNYDRPLSCRRQVDLLARALVRCESWPGILKSASSACQIRCHSSEVTTSSKQTWQQWLPHRESTIKAQKMQATSRGHWAADEWMKRMAPRQSGSEFVKLLGGGWSGRSIESSSIDAKTHPGLGAPHGSSNGLDAAGRIKHEGFLRCGLLASSRLPAFCLHHLGPDLHYPQGVCTARGFRTPARTTPQADTEPNAIHAESSCSRAPRICPGYTVSAPGQELEHYLTYTRSYRCRPLLERSFEATCCQR